MNYAQLSRPNQTQPLTPSQVQNNAGGYVFALDVFKQLERFLILGSDKPTYYASAQRLTVDNAMCVVHAWERDASRTKELIIDISTNGRAPKNDPAIFALALGSINQHDHIRQLALASVPAVCRTATHLFQFVQLATELGRGWGRAMKRTISSWYDDKSADRLAHQMVKYRERHGFNHNRLIDLAHPNKHSALYQWATNHTPTAELPAIIADFEEAQRGDYLSVLKRNPNLPWECLPTEALNDTKVWELLAPTMPITALMRNLSRLARLNLTKPLSDFESVIANRFHNLDDAKLHPFNILVAQKTYALGRPFMGQSAPWTPNSTIIAALEDAYYQSFGNVESSGKRTLIGLDVSGSMSAQIMGSPLQCREAAAAMCMITARTEPASYVMGFSTTFMDLGITKNDSMAEVQRKTRGLPFRGTDCSLPMEHAITNNLNVDQFVVYTDNETYAGRRHPSEALKAYRRHSGIDAKLIVVGMTATRFTIADPTDAGMLDVVGFDTAAPQLISQF